MGKVHFSDFIARGWLIVQAGKGYLLIYWSNNLYWSFNLLVQLSKLVKMNIGNYVPVDHSQGCTIFWQNKKSENFFSFGSPSAFRLHCLLVGLNSYEQQLPSSAQLR